MTECIRRELFLPKPPERVWQAIASSDSLAKWMYPNDFEPRVGHHFTFEVPPKPAVGFEGLSVQCEVLQCEEPTRLVFSWSAGTALADTRVSFDLQPENGGTRIFFQHSGFDISQPFGKQALQGARFGWAEMLSRLASILSDMSLESA